MWEHLVPVGPGPLDALTDVEGILVGHHHRVGGGWSTGVTVVLTPGGATAGVDVRGGGPGTRETALLDPHNFVEHVHAVCLSGGSAYGLDAASGVMRWCEEHGIGLRVGDEAGHVVPIVPAAVLFDLKAGTWGCRPDASFGHAAAAGAHDGPVPQGSVGAGAGAAAGPLKGGIGTASTRLSGGFTVAALVAVNSRGHVVDPRTGTFFGTAHLSAPDLDTLTAPTPGELAASAALLAPSQKMSRLNTTIGVVATDAALTKAECERLAMMAHDGLARAIHPVHTLFDGDTLFALATGHRDVVLDAGPVGDAGPVADDGLPPEGYAVPASRASVVNDLGAAAADAVTRAVVRAVLHATATGAVPAYRDVFPSAVRAWPGSAAAWPR